MSKLGRSRTSVRIQDRLIDELIGDFFDPAAARTRDIIDSFAMNQASFCEAIRQRLADGGQDGPDLELGKLTA